jgi:DNA-binding response OmpR family regulator
MASTSRGGLLDAARGEDSEGFDRAVGVHVKNIRRKIRILTGLAIC